MGRKPTFPSSYVGLSNSAYSHIHLLDTENNIRTYELHFRALRMCSEYLHKVLPASPHEQRLAVHLALSAPKPFEPFANWLFRGSLDTVTEYKCFA